MPRMISTSFITGTVPDETPTTDGTRTMAEVHNVYGLLEAKATYEGMIAARANHLELMKTLIAAGADPKLRSDNGSTLLMYAAAAKLPASKRLRERVQHAHAGADKFYYVCSGRARLTVGEETREVAEGGIVWAPAGVPLAAGRCPGMR